MQLVNHYCSAIKYIEYKDNVGEPVQKKFKKFFLLWISNGANFY